MKAPRIYLETTIFNYYFEAARDAHPYTKRLFDEIEKSIYEPFASRYVIDELNLAPEPKRTSMLRLIDRYDIQILSMNAEAERLSDLYVSEGVIPRRYRTDATHIAIATVNYLNFIVSLNFKHIVKRRTVLLTELINIREGYMNVGIFSPMEVVDDDD